MHGPRWALGRAAAADGTNGLALRGRPRRRLQGGGACQARSVRGVQSVQSVQSVHGKACEQDAVASASADQADSHTTVAAHRPWGRYSGASC